MLWLGNGSQRNKHRCASKPGSDAGRDYDERGFPNRGVSAPEDDLEDVCQGHGEGGYNDEELVAAVPRRKGKLLDLSSRAEGESIRFEYLLFDSEPC